MMTGHWHTFIEESRTWESSDSRWLDIVNRSELELIRLTATAPDDRAVDTALEFYQKIPWSLINSTMRETQTRWMIRLGRLLDRIGYREKADSMLQNAAEIAEEAQLFRYTCIALMERGELARRQGDIANAYLSQGKAQEIAQQNHLPREEADALNNLAIAAVESGHLNRAEELLRDSLKVVEKIGEKRLEGHIYNNLGVILCMKNTFRTALAEFTRAIPCREAASDTRGLAETFHNMSMTYKDMDDLTRADTALEKAMNLTRKLNDKGLEANIMLTRVELLILSGDDVYALSMAEQLANLQSRLKDFPGLAENHKLTGQIHIRRKNYPEAARYLEKSVCTYRSLGILLGEAESLKELGLCARLQDQKEKALVCFNHSRELYKALGNKAEQINLTQIIQSF